MFSSVRTRRLNLAQRIVVIIAVGAAFIVVGDAITTPQDPTGWTGYAPLESGGVFCCGSFGRSVWHDAALWLVLIVLWSVLSLFLLRGSRRRDRDAASGANEGPDAASPPS